jgi:hypothetical protein
VSAAAPSGAPGRLARFVPAVFALIGIATALPVLAAFRPEALASLYGVTPPSDPLLPLMRHRQVLLGILGAALLAAAFRPALRTPVLLAALASKLSFVALVLSAETTPAIARVALGDAVAIVLLAASAVVERRSRIRVVG